MTKDEGTKLFLKLKGRTMQPAETAAPETPIEYERRGTKLILPENVSLETAGQWIARLRTEEDRTVKIHEEIDAFPYDGALALTKALKRKFGWADAVATEIRGFFGTMKAPPNIVGVETAYGVTEQVVLSRFEIPGVDGWIAPGFHRRNNQFRFHIDGEVRSKHRGVIADLAELVRSIVRTESIYRGKAVEVRFAGDEEAMFNNDPAEYTPRFMDLSTVREDELVFPESVQRQIDVSLFTPVRFTEVCRAQRIPLKRGILLTGPYGVGKTLTAKVAAKVCTDNGWTFVLLKDVEDLDDAIAFAGQYAPAMVFAEDIDEILGTDERSSEVNDILNTIDGVEIKGKEIMVVLTTNHVERVNVAMLRPGRLDAVIELTPPDEPAVERLLRFYGRGQIPATENLTGARERLAGQIPAVIREVVERAKLASIARGQTGELNNDDLEVAADGMLQHLRLLNRTAPTAPGAMAVFGAAVGNQLYQALRNSPASDLLPAPRNGLTAGLEA